MPIVDPDHIACFECVEVVHPFTQDGVKYVACACCGVSAPIENALDDCFVFIVASAITGRFPKLELIGSCLFRAREKRPSRTA